MGSIMEIIYPVIAVFIASLAMSGGSSTQQIIEIISTSQSGSNSKSGSNSGRGNSGSTGSSFTTEDFINPAQVSRNPVCGRGQISTLHRWYTLTYATPPGFKADSSYDPKDAFITGIVASGPNLYLSTPRTTSILPSTLNTVPTTASSSSSPPPLQPFPNLSWNTFNKNSPDCQSSLISVHRTTKDNCNRLWVLDSGQLFENDFDFENICPPKIVIFDMTTRKMVDHVTIPSNVLHPSSRLVNIILDTETSSPTKPRTSGSSALSSNSQCEVKFVYIADTTVPGVVVYNVRNDSFQRISHPYMNPDPCVPNYTVKGQTVTAFYGIIGMDIAGSDSNRNLYFSPFASNITFKIPTSALQRPANYRDRSDIPVTGVFKRLGPGIGFLQDRSNGCLLYNPIDQGTIVGWNPQSESQNVLATNRSSLTLAYDMSQDFSNTRITYVAQGPLQSQGMKYGRETGISVLMVVRTS